MSGDLGAFIKKLVLPAEFVPPRTLMHDNVTAHAITRDDVGEDVRGINDSLALIRETRGGKWPTEPVTEEEIIVDEYWHECEFRDRKSFSYILTSADLGYIGCAYLYPMGVRRPLTLELAQHDVDASWWVTPGAYDRGYYRTVYQGLRRWASIDFPFSAPHFSNIRIPD